jgi:hypothetical protein
MKFLILAPFVEIGTIYGMVSGLEANGHTWESIPTKPGSQARKPDFPAKVLRKYEQGNFDTILIGKGSPIPIGPFRQITAGADTTYWCPDSVSGNGCGPPGRPEDVGLRGLACTRIACTGTEGARWWRQNGYKGRIAQVYQGCRHNIWRPGDLETPRTGQNQLCFLGTANYKGDGGRQKKFEALKRAGFKLCYHKRIFHQAASKLYYNSAICLNFVCGTPGEGASPVGITSNRLVRLLTSGGFALTERNVDIDHSFEDGNQLAKFDFGDAAHCVDRAQYYMSNPNERLEIARRGWEWSENWSWDQQMEKLVRFIDGEDLPADGAAAEYVGTLGDTVV